MAMFGESLTIDVDLVTPALIGGVDKHSRDQTTRPSLRTTELRGLLRYWFRVAYASVVFADEGKEEDLSRVLFDREARLFGSTAGRSRVVARFENAPEMARLDLRIRGGRPDEGPPDRGRAYLGYGPIPNTGQAVGLIGRGAKISLELFRLSEAEIGILAAAIWLLGAIGGLGARARKGFGSMRLRPHENWQGFDWQPQPTIEKHLEKMNQGLDRALELAEAFARENRDPIRRGNASRPVQLRTIEGIKSLRGLEKVYSTSDEAHEAIGRLVQDFRSTIRRKKNELPPLADYFEVKDALSGALRAPPRLERAALGLPLNFYFRSLNGKKTRIVPHAPPALGISEKDLDRVPSPLWIRIVDLHHRAQIRYGVALINMAGAGKAEPLLGLEAKLERRAPVKARREIIEDLIDYAVANCAKKGMP